MNRRELFVSFLSPSNRHFLHQKCQGPVIPDTLDSSFVRAGGISCLDSIGRIFSQ
jgi:hypothetical protein